MANIIDTFRGKWLSIFTALGIVVRDDGKHSGCPICGEGRNSHRFRMDDIDGSGSWYCTQCGAGDGIMLVIKVFDCTFREALDRIEKLNVNSMTGKSASGVTIPYQDPVKTRKNLNELWTSSKPLIGSDFVSKYLHGRGISLTPDNVRFCEGCYNTEINRCIPAMAAKFVSIDNKPISIMRTYLDTQGVKREDIEVHKMLMPNVDPLKGGAIRLFSPADKLFMSGVLGVAEGIETACSCAQLHGIATWACTSTALLSAWKPPKSIRNVVIYTDNDANFAGQAAAYALAHRLILAGLIAKVKIPTDPGTDWNDVLINKKKE